MVLNKVRIKGLLILEAISGPTPVFLPGIDSSTQRKVALPSVSSSRIKLEKKLSRVKSKISQKLYFAIASWIWINDSSKKEKKLNFNKFLASLANNFRQRQALPIISLVLAVFIIILLFIILYKPQQTIEVNSVDTLKPTNVTTPTTFLSITPSIIPVAQQSTPIPLADVVPTATFIAIDTTTASTSTAIRRSTFTPIPTFTPGPHLIVFAIGVSRQNTPDSNGSMESTNVFEAGEEVFAFMYYAQARPGLDSIEVNLVANDNSQMVQTFTFDKEVGTLIIPINKLATGRYKVEILYNNILLDNLPVPEFIINAPVTSTPTKPPPTFTPPPRPTPKPCDNGGSGSVFFATRIYSPPPVSDKPDQGSGGIQGIVLDRQGQPIQGATVRVSTTSGYSFEAKTNSGGFYIITGLGRNTWYVVVLDAPPRANCPIQAAAVQINGLPNNIGIVDFVESIP